MLHLVKVLYQNKKILLSHPNWRGHNFNFKGKKLKTNVFKVMEAIQHEQKIQFVQDSIFLKMKKKNDSTL